MCKQKVNSQVCVLHTCYAKEALQTKELTYLMAHFHESARLANEGTWLGMCSHDTPRSTLTSALSLSASFVSQVVSCKMILCLYLFSPYFCSFLLRIKFIWAQERRVPFRGIHRMWAQVVIFLFRSLRTKAFQKSGSRCWTWDTLLLGTLGVVDVSFPGDI